MERYIVPRYVLSQSVREILRYTLGGGPFRSCPQGHDFDGDCDGPTGESHEKGV